MYHNDIIFSGYIKCDFGADFSEKRQNSILCYSLKKAMNYHIKHFEGPILALRGFSQVLDIIHLYLMFQNPIVAFSPFL